MKENRLKIHNWQCKNFFVVLIIRTLVKLIKYNYCNDIKERKFYKNKIKKVSNMHGVIGSD